MAQQQPKKDDQQKANAPTPQKLDWRSKAIKYGLTVNAALISETCKSFSGQEILLLLYIYEMVVLLSKSNRERVSNAPFALFLLHWAQ